MDQERARIGELYRGPGGDIWDRIELERPGTYLEENAVLGRRDEEVILFGWLGDLAGRRILDVGCGRGRLARRLASAGARVVAIDATLRPLPAAGSRHAETLRFVVGDVRDALAPPAAASPFDAVVVREVLQDLHPAERPALLAAVAELGAPRIYVTFRLESRWLHLLRLAWPQGLAESVDPVPVLRHLHLRTAYRLSRQETVRRRSFHTRLAELSRD